MITKLGNLTVPQCDFCESFQEVIEGIAVRLGDIPSHLDVTKRSFDLCKKCREKQNRYGDILTTYVATVPITITNASAGNITWTRAWEWSGIVSGSNIIAVTGSAT